ncbi:MAG: Bacterial periplasmic spermidine/putrescine-binding protein [Clostridia bacterium]|nr:Bacterial periplasmic spermidine/putrescine-binding protein [Clostridia bacterium]
MKMLKKVIGTTLIISCMGLMLSGCGASKKSSGEINVFNWTEYMPESVLKIFEEETGIKVNYSTYSSNEDMLSKVQSEAAGTYDIVVPSDYMVDLMAKQGLLEELNKDNIPNLKNISPAYLDQYYDKRNVYTVPYLGGVVTLCVNKSKVSDPITSYKQLFDSKYENSLVVLDDTRIVVGMVAKSLGYSMSETDDTILAEIKDKLLELKPNIMSYDSDSPKTVMIDGSASVGYIWNAEIAMSMSENPDIEIVFPEEGPYLFFDNMAIPKGSKNKENAEKFIDFICKPEIAKMIVEEFPYVTPNTEAINLLGDDYINNKACNPPAAEVAKGEYVKEVGDKISVYDSMWTELKK